MLSALTEKSMLLIKKWRFVRFVLLAAINEGNDDREVAGRSYREISFRGTKKQKVELIDRKSCGKSAAWWNIVA